MKIAVLGTDNAKNELFSGGETDTVTTIPVTDISDFELHPDVDAIFDLSFELNCERVELLKKISAKPVFINAVAYTLTETDSSFIRFNGWPTFLNRNLFEAACSGDAQRSNAEKIVAALGKKIEWVPDVKGFIAARVVSMIVNEAYFALEEGVSIKKEIDTAMKLGTNYPYGPFEWSEKIGVKNILELLTELSKINSRYQPASSLQKEALF